jgi:hypothetical protein
VTRLDQKLCKSCSDLFAAKHPNFH